MSAAAPTAAAPKVTVNTALVKDATSHGRAYIMTADAMVNWIARVDLADGQALIAFRKFGTVGIGFEREDADWNTNLPCSCPAEEIYEHIKVNKGSPRITKRQCLEAIEALREVGAKYLGRTTP